MDAAECPPTFGTDPRRVQYVMAGGEKALGRAQEADEDSRALGRRDLMRKRVTADDVVVGVSAGGHTPYTVAAVEYARERGARTVGVTCIPASPLARVVDCAIVAEVGAEVVSGSTRMKAGTAQKMILNMLSTGAMARLGRVYGNLMIEVHPSNGKLKERGVAALQRVAEVDREPAEKALRAADMNVPVALVMLKAGVGRREALRRLKLTQGHVRQAITRNPGGGKRSGAR